MKKHTLATLGAILAMCQAQVAQAQAAAEVCVDPNDLADATVYAAPEVISGMQVACGNALGPDSFLMSQATQWAEKFQPYRDAKWPGMKSFFLVFAAQGDSEMLAQMPDSVLRPMISVVLPDIVGTRTSDKNCDKVDRALELLAPLPPENIGGLASLLLESLERDNPPICKREEG